MNSLMKSEAGLILVISSLVPGGAEKVMSIIANQASQRIKVSLILLSKKEKYHPIDERVRVIEPNFVIEQMPRWLFTWRIFWWLRGVLNGLAARSVLSFSGKYNAFVLLASMGLRKRVFVSDRSRPGISYGKFLDILNPLVYRLSAGIIAQTSQARRLAEQRTKHSNIAIIPNPVHIPTLTIASKQKEKIVLNVGRFIPSKHQEWLVNYFESVPSYNWSLVFLGEGKCWEQVLSKARISQMQQNIHLHGNVTNIDQWYQKAAIFAFTSTSEGFPNSLAEAMSHGCACIAFDCTAGPADIIDDGINGFLVAEGDHETYRLRLAELIENEKMRIRFGKAAFEKMKQFDQELITQRYLDFILS